MTGRAGTQAANHTKELILGLLLERAEVALRELVLCFASCKTIRALLDGKGFCIGTAWLCACLESGRSPTEILSRLWSARGSVVAYEKPLTRVDQVTSFLVRHEHYRVTSGWAWAQLFYQEPDGGVLCEGVKKMHWVFKRRFIQELHKSTGYHPGMCTLMGGKADCQAVAWSPDGKLVAIGNDKFVSIWDVAIGKEVMAPLSGHLYRVNSVAWSPDGKQVASGSLDKTIRIWDVATGKEAMRPLTGHRECVYSVAWSPDGKLIASGSNDTTIRIWDIATGKEVMRPMWDREPVLSVAWSPDGKRLASGSNNIVRIWDVSTPGRYGKEALSPLTSHSDDVLSVAWSPDGKLIATGSRDRAVRVWSVATCKEAMPPLTGHSYPVQSVAWSPDSKLVASGSDDRTVVIWDVATGKEAVGPLMPPLTGHSGPVLSVAWSPDGKLVASGSHDKTIRIWDVAAGKEVMPPQMGHSEEVHSVALSSDDKLIASSGDKMTRIWESATGKEVIISAAGWSDPKIQALDKQLDEECEDRCIAFAGQHVVYADRDTVLIYKALDDSCVEQDWTDWELVALFRCPRWVNTLACRPPYICAGCAGGQVLLLEAPILCDGSDV